MISVECQFVDVDIYIITNKWHETNVKSVFFFFNYEHDDDKILGLKKKIV